MPKRYLNLKQMLGKLLHRNERDLVWKVATEIMLEELLFLTFTRIYSTTANAGRKIAKNKLHWFLFNHPVSTLTLWYLVLLVNRGQNICESGIVRGAYSTLLGTNRGRNTTIHFLQLLHPIVTLLWRSQTKQTGLWGQRGEIQTQGRLIEDRDRQKDQRCT